MLSLKVIKKKCEKYETPAFKLPFNQAFSLCVFAFNCHLNVIPIADSLTRPTTDRMRKLSARVNVFQWLFYSLIGVTGAPQGKLGMIMLDLYLAGGLDHVFHIIIGNFIIPADELIFFRGVGQPPTRYN